MQEHPQSMETSGRHTVITIRDQKGRIYAARERIGSDDQSVMNGAINRFRPSVASVRIFIEQWLGEDLDAASANGTYFRTKAEKELTKI